MLTPEYLWSVSDSMVNIWDELNTWAIKDIAKRIMSAELYNYYDLPGTARYRAWLLNQSGMHYEDMEKEVARLTKKSDSEIVKLFENAGLVSIANDFAPIGKEPYSLPNDKKAMQILQSAMAQTNGEIHNFTRTTMESSDSACIDALDKAYFDVRSGGKSYTEAISEAIEDVSKNATSVKYPTGHRDTVETSVRRAVMTGLNQGTAKLALHNCDVLGTDYVIVSAHMGARYNDTDKIANHFGWQGGVYKIHGTGSLINESSGVGNSVKKLFRKLGKKYENDYIPNLQEETGFPSNPLGLCGYNCRHSFYPFVAGVDDPSNYKHIVADEEKSKKQYDLSQEQRMQERNIRGIKAKLTAYETAIENCKDDGTKFELQLQYDKLADTLRYKNNKYNEFCNKNGLQKEPERIKIAQWNREKARNAAMGANRYKEVLKMEDASIENTNDWSKTVQHEVSKEDRNSIFEYGRTKNVNVVDLSKFDGEKKLVEEQIDTISSIMNEFSDVFDKPINLKVGIMEDADFAITTNRTISINNNALRNREITEKNIANGDFASKTHSDIAAHEMGHLIAKVKGNNGLELFKQAYYNVYNKEIEYSELISYIEEHISKYATKYYGDLQSDAIHGRIKIKKFKEIIPEVIVSNKNNKTKLTDEFIRLLKG